VTAGRFLMMILSAIVIGDARHLAQVRTIIVRDNEEAELVKRYALRICDEPDRYLRSRLKSAPP
jgi:hypothetical protein